MRNWTFGLHQNGKDAKTMKRQVTDREKIFANPHLIKDSYAKYSKLKKTNNTAKLWKRYEKEISRWQWSTQKRAQHHRTPGRHQAKPWWATIHSYTAGSDQVPSGQGTLQASGKQQGPPRWRGVLDAGWSPLKEETLASPCRRECFWQRLRTVTWQTHSSERQQREESMVHYPNKLSLHQHVTGTWRISA